jgi:hypothetical protein
MTSRNLKKIHLKVIKDNSVQDRLSSINLDGEYWKNIPKYPTYFISTHGRVWNNHMSRLLKCSSNGTYNLTHNEITTAYHADELVTQIFIGPKPEGNNIDHIDQDKCNNCLSNLQYLPSSEKNDNEISYEQIGKRVDQFDMNGNYICTWESITSASNAINGIISGISQCCLDKQSTYYGFKWQFATEVIEGEVWKQFDPDKLTFFSVPDDIETDFNDAIDDNGDFNMMNDDKKPKIYMASNMGRIQGPYGSQSYGHRRKSKYFYIRINHHRMYVQRIICEVFKGPPPSPEYVADHIDDNPSNNRADNLQWLSGPDNTRKSLCKVVEYVNSKDNTITEYASANEAFKVTGQPAEAIKSKCLGIIRQDSDCFWRYKGDCKGSNKNPLNVTGLAIKQFDMIGTLINTFPSINEAIRNHIKTHDPKLPYKSINATAIIECCKGQRDQIGGFKWEYVIPPVKIKLDDPSKMIQQYSTDGIHVKNFNDADHVATQLKIPRTSIIKCCNQQIRSTNGFIFKYAIDQCQIIPLTTKIYPTHYQLDGKLIKRYESSYEAGKDLNLQKGTVTSFCIGSKKTSDGTVWKHEIIDPTTHNYITL